MSGSGNNITIIFISNSQNMKSVFEIWFACFLSPVISVFI